MGGEKRKGEKAEKTKCKRKGRKETRGGSDDEDGLGKFNRKKPKVEEKPRVDIKNLLKPDFALTIKDAIVKNFWTGVEGQTSPSEELKEQRKSIGVLVKGTLSLCPPPILTMADEACPDTFRKVFKKISLKTPSTVQKQCWPAALAGSNVLGIAPTGSGKTIAYLLPMIPHINHQEEVMKRKFSNKAGGPPKSTIDKLSPYALVLVPTRELAIQINGVCMTLRRLFGIHAGAIYGGQDRESQMDELRKGEGIKIAISTPGRLLDLVATKQLSLMKVSYFVIDEADRMLQLGFYDQLQAISQQIRPDRQTLLFSATFPGKLREASEKWVGDATFIRCNTLDLNLSETPSQKKEAAALSAPNRDTKRSEADEMDEGEEDGEDGDAELDQMAAAAAETTDAAASRDVSSIAVSESITQQVHVCASHKKPRLLIKFLLARRAEEKESKQRQPGAMLVFCTKIKTVKFVEDFLRRQEVKGMITIHGKMPQTQREQAVESFRCGKNSVLLATDVAARGLHIKRLKYVVNYDFPGSLEQYCHRIGRTGRQGQEGFAYSLITRNMAPMVGDLIKLLLNSNQQVEANLAALKEEFDQMVNSGATLQAETKKEDSA